MPRLALFGKALFYRQSGFASQSQSVPLDWPASQKHHFTMDLLCSAKPFHHDRWAVLRKALCFAKPVLMTDRLFLAEPINLYRNALLCKANIARRFGSRLCFAKPFRHIDIFSRPFFFGPFYVSSGFASQSRSVLLDRPASQQHHFTMDWLCFAKPFHHYRRALLRKALFDDGLALPRRANRFGCNFAKPIYCEGLALGFASQSHSIILLFSAGRFLGHF